VIPAGSFPGWNVNRDYRRWFSPSLGRDMEMLVFGHAGARVLVFPTSLGKFYEWEDREMIAALAGPIERGWLQFFCVDSVDAESWYAKNRHPSLAAARHGAYEAYLINEVLPFSESINQNPFLITTGASFGAYHSLNFALRHPHLVGRVLAMSGLYDIKKMTGGYEDDGVYANDPSHYMIHMSDEARLDAIRRIDIVLALGKDDPNRANNEHMSGVLWSRGIWHAYRLWDGWAHDWPWWQQMAAQYIGGHD
jgi:esterase/lipase superfamily enzyme